MNSIVPVYSVARLQIPVKATQWVPTTGHPWVRLPCTCYTKSGEPILSEPGYGYVMESSRGERELVVRPNNWIVEDTDGLRTVLSQEEFKARYEILGLIPSHLK